MNQQQPPQPKFLCPECGLTMIELNVAKRVHERYCSDCDISIDSKGKEHRGGKRGPGDVPRMEEV